MKKGRIFFATLVMILLLASNVMAATKRTEADAVNNSKNTVNEEDIITITYPYFYGHKFHTGQKIVSRGTKIIDKETGKELKAQWVDKEGNPIKEYTFYDDGSGYVNLYFKIDMNSLTEKERVWVEETINRGISETKFVTMVKYIKYIGLFGLAIFIICCILQITKKVKDESELSTEQFRSQNSKDARDDTDDEEHDDDNEEDPDYVWDENEQDIKTAKERLQRLFPYTSFTISESDLYDSYGRFDSSDGNTYELAIKPGLGYEAYALFERNTGKVIDDWVVVDENEEDEDKEHDRIAVMAKERLQSIFPGTSFVINDYWNDGDAEFEEEPLACLISYDSGFHAYTVSYVEYMSDMSLVFVHDMQTGKLIDNFTC